MPAETKIYILILGLGLINFLPRVLPMVILSKFQMPQVVVDWLGFVPAAVLAAIVAPYILMPENTLFISTDNKYLLAAIPSFAIARKTNSLIWTLLAGMLSMALLQL